MTCDEVRDRLLEVGIDELETLEPHLRACPECAALADAVVRTEDDLRTHLENAMTSIDLDSKWDAATAAVPERTGRWLHGGLIGLAAAAVLAVTVWSSGPFSERPQGPDPAGQRAAASLVLGDALDALDDFDAIEIEPFHEDMDRAAQDEYLQDLLRDKSTAMREAEAALAEAADDPDPSVRAMALLEMGELSLRMGSALMELPIPTYLNEGQVEVYGMAIDDKAAAQWLKARSTLELGLALADEEGLDAEAEWLDEALADAEDLLLSLEPTPEELEARPGGDVPPVPAPVIGDGTVKQTIERYSGQLQYCYETALRDQPGLAGTVELSWTLDAGAVVGTPQVLTDTTGATDDSLTRCMTDKIRRWSFPEDRDGEVVWPFVFRTP